MFYLLQDGCRLMSYATSPTSGSILKAAGAHCREVLGHALEHLLDGGGVPGEGHRHLEASANVVWLKSLQGLK